MTVGKFKHSVA